MACVLHAPHAPHTRRRREMPSRLPLSVTLLALEPSSGKVKIIRLRSQVLRSAKMFPFRVQIRAPDTPDRASPGIVYIRACRQPSFIAALPFICASIGRNQTECASTASYANYVLCEKHLRCKAQHIHHETLRIDPQRNGSYSFLRTPIIYIPNRLNRC